MGKIASLKGRRKNVHESVKKKKNNMEQLNIFHTFLEGSFFTFIRLRFFSVTFVSISFTKIFIERVQTCRGDFV